jgi:hypothetical protein
VNAEELVLCELKSLRKRTDGASVGAIAECPTISQLLGNGDPMLAWSQLQHLALGVEWSKDIEAACYSLAFASTKKTHLDRLVEFAAEFYMDQRQARRYSDRGLLQLASLICTNWVTHAVPDLLMVVIPSSPSTITVYVRCCRPEAIGMHTPMLTYRNDLGEKAFDITWIEWRDDDRICLRLEQPVEVDLRGETSITARWSGELWPKFSVQMAGHNPALTEVVECLGAKAMVRFIPSVTDADCITGERSITNTL